MDKPVRDWGRGIPQYSEDDILKGIELHAFCTNIVAQSMQNDGYIIEGVVLNQTPTQVVANKNGKPYFVIVAGGVYPNEGRISFSMKRQFAEFCKKQGYIPMFASVGIMSCDPERAIAGLALKYDGYKIKYSGVVTLIELEEPNPASDDYKAFCVERIINAYEKGRFDTIYSLFSDEIQFHSQWVLEPLMGKTALIDYFEGKGRAIRNSSTKIKGSVVVIDQQKKRTGNIVLMSEPGKLCALLRQELDGNTNWIFISPKFNKDNQLCELALNDPQLFSFSPYYAFE